MASVVDTSVKNFNWTMSGAPVVNGTTNSWIALFDAVGVNGFDLKNASSLTVAGGVATLAFTGTHSAQVESVILVANSSIAALNGEQKVTAVGAGVVKFATAAADGVASGAITFKMAPAGWTKVHSSAGKAVYKSNDPAASGMFFRFDDSGAQVVRVIGYESMSDVDTGVGPFPTAAQIGGGGVWAKSSVASATAVPWHLVADSRTVYHAIQAAVPSNANSVTAPIRGFGDPIALRPSGDPFSAFLSYSVNLTPLSSADGCLGNNTFVQVASPRSYTGLGGGMVQSAQIWGLGNLVAHYSGVTDVHGPFPSRISGALYLFRKVLAQNGNADPRAELPGLHALAQSEAWGTFKAGLTTPGTGALAGRTLMALNCVGSNNALNVTSNISTTGVVMVDITGPWR